MNPSTAIVSVGREHAALVCRIEHLEAYIESGNLTPGDCLEQLRVQLFSYRSVASALRSRLHGFTSASRCAVVGA
ncbi:MAG: hypothetical protein AAFX06_19345 [Planctomycetota bacterium]